MKDTPTPPHSPTPTLSPPGLGLLLVLFVALRLMSLAWFRPLHVDVETFFFPFAYLQGRGLYPFVHYWFEYPPVLAYELIGLRMLVAPLLGTGSVAWQAACFLRAVQVSAVAWEAASLCLIYLLARRLRGRASALWACWLYIALFATGFVSASYLDNFPAFVLLAALALLASSRVVWAALVLGVGFMTKVFPAVLLPVAWKATARWSRRAAVVVVFVSAVAVIAAPFLATGFPWLRCWVESALRRPPWQTPWALLEGQYEFGYLGPRAEELRLGLSSFLPKYGVRGEDASLLLSLPPTVYTRSAPDRGDPAKNAQANLALLKRDPRHRTVFYGVVSHFATDLGFIGQQTKRPWLYPAAGLIFALFYLWTFARLPAELSPERRILFAVFTVVLFFLYSKGWSPQFVAYLIPVFLIVFPVREAAVWCLLLSVTAFLEMPVWAIYVHPLASLPGHPGLAALDHLLLQAAILGRTAILLVVLARLYGRMFRGRAAPAASSSRNSSQ